mmetsp:Transcript_24422/g.39078  ORF Transcript_24422/g.39078 Transcript_24422/m.39078 type:complete len:253 (+) Transcript_24422:61-819(+)
MALDGKRRRIWRKSPPDSDVDMTSIDICVRLLAETSRASNTRSSFAIEGRDHDCESAPRTPPNCLSEPAPVTPPRQLQPPRRCPHLALAVVNPRMLWKPASCHARHDIEFESVESFKLWLATTATSCGRHLIGRTSCDPSPGYGLVSRLCITDRALCTNDIGSVRWIHWRDGGVHVSTMTDDFPTPCAPGERRDEIEAEREARIRREHLRQRLHFILLWRRLSATFELPKDCFHAILTCMVPKTLSIGATSM